MNSPAVARTVRAWLFGSALVAALIVLNIALSRSPPASFELPLNDFVQYWAAGRLSLDGDNPYDLPLLGAIEQEAGRIGDVLPMYNPPWTLGLVMPFAWLPPQLAYMAWMILQLTVLAYCALSTWRFYGGTRAQTGLALILTFAFVPTFLALFLAQISPLVLLGAVWFLQAERRGQDFLAGMATVLLAIKPHLAYLFWLALFLWTIRSRRWRVLAGVGVGFGITLILPLLLNPYLLGQFVDAFLGRPPAQYQSPTMGTLLRMVLGTENFLLQYLAMVPGVLWLAWFWLRRGSNWNWGREMPWLLFVSIITAAYGAWPFDLVLLIVPLVQVAANASTLHKGDQLRVKGIALLFLAVNLAAGIMVLNLVNFVWFLWLAPALLGVYALAQVQLPAKNLALPPLECIPS